MLSQPAYRESASARLFLLLCVLISTAEYLCPVVEAQREDPRARAARLAREHCVTPFGTVLGWINGVPALSNCNEHHISNLSSYVGADSGQPFDVEPSSADADTLVEIGMRWQCVEFARRYWWTRRSVAFLAVESAVEIWALKSATPRDHFDLSNADTETSMDYWRIPLRRLSNGAASLPPHIDDLLVWAKQPGMPHGHVAVVVAIRPVLPTDAGKVVASSPSAGVTEEIFATVEIAEQNYHNRHWAGRNFSRVLSLAKRVEANPEVNSVPSRAVIRFRILDPDGAVLLGWLRLGSPNDHHELLDDEL